MKIVIAGGGSVGTAIATDLAERHHDIVVIEQRLDAVTKLRDLLQFPNIRVEHGDACEVKALNRADISGYDVMIAATGDDEDNLVVSWLARTHLGITRVIARVNNSRNEWLFDENWGVDVKVSIPTLITSLVDEFVEVGAVVPIMDVAQGSMEMVEVTLDSDAPVILNNSTLDEIALPDVAKVVAIVRDEMPLSPSSSTTFQEHDHVLLLVKKGEHGCLNGIFTAQ
jgi:trk system potassium uptake protein TrkA